jgi:hypothetical protein
LFDEDVLAGVGLASPEPEASPAVRLQLRLPWYRSLPLSCIEQLTVAIDGDELPQDRLAVVVNGDSHPLTDVAELHEVWWFVLDTIDLRVSSPEDWSPGAHQVDLALQLRIPYGDPHFRDIRFTQVAQCTKELTLLGRDE